MGFTGSYSESASSPSARCCVFKVLSRLYFAGLLTGSVLSHECTLETLPTVRRSGPYRLFFYSADRDEPPHVHVEREEAEAKFWLVPVRLEMSRGFGRSESAD